MKMSNFILLLFLFQFAFQAEKQHQIKLDSTKGSYVDGELITSEPINGVAEIDARIIISEPGTYVLSGKYRSQVKVTLPNETDGTVTLILNGTNISNPLGPGILFTKVHEIDLEEHSEENPITYEKAIKFNFTDAGAKLIIADDSENMVVGNHSDKFDGAVHSKMSMTVNGGKKGNGRLTIWGNCTGCEGLDSDKHLEINGGILNIAAGDDGINASEEFGSAAIINGGKIFVNAGSFAERGDGVDANGILIINGGELTVSANAYVDAGLEGEKGIILNGGKVVSVGCGNHAADLESGQNTMNLYFDFLIEPESVLTIEDNEGNVLVNFCPAKAGYIEGTQLHQYSEATITFPELETYKIYKVFLDGKPLGFRNRKKSRTVGAPRYGQENQNNYNEFDFGNYGGFNFGGYNGGYGSNKDDGHRKDRKGDGYSKVNKDNGDVLPDTSRTNNVNPNPYGNYNRGRNQRNDNDELDNFFILTTRVESFGTIRKIK